MENNISVGENTYRRSFGNKYGMCVYDKELNMHNHKITNPNK